ncbi:MAG: pseudouridine synthase [Gammaproteobacteria bacterium]|nr:pseudouridine synthase [Gammaproteobacteria bacterium]MCP5137123.1 pseudouridine synthase [Gammaproteobacteria bacterium]
MSERIQKALAAGGYGSRRRIEELIKAGRISINGEICELGAQVAPGDKIRIDGRLLDIDLRVQRRRRVIALHKVEGVVTTMDDPEGRPTVFDRLPQMRFGRWIAVGRLDINTTGLILLTNDGELANRLMHPSYQIEREYAVRVLGEVEPSMLKALREGVMLEDGMAHFEHLVEGRRSIGDERANNWFHVGLTEGRNREVRRMWEAVGLKVSRLSRVRYGPISLPRDLPRGRWKELGELEVRALCETVGLAPQEPLEDVQRGRRNGRARPPAERDPRGPRATRGTSDKPQSRRARERAEAEAWRSSPRPDEASRGRKPSSAGDKRGFKSASGNPRRSPDRSGAGAPRGSKPAGDRGRSGR